MTHGFTILCVGAVLVTACGGTEGAPTVELPVETGSALPGHAETDLGYAVQLARTRVAVTGIQFTIAGEQHAYWHPGHSGGGEVTGELPGDFVLEWAGQARVLGTASLIVGDYRGANFALRAATAADVSSDDPLLGHTFHLVGTVAKGSESRALDIVLDVEPDTYVIGAPFDARIEETTTTPLALIFLPTDPNEGDTPFDTIDFFALPQSGNVIQIRPGSEPHNLVRRAIQTHDHFGVVTR